MKLYSALLVVASLAQPTSVLAKTVTAGPSDYKSKLGALKAGDVLELSAGTYPLLSISNLAGTKSAWITIRGPVSGAPAVIEANPCCNVIELKKVRYLALENLVVDGNNNGGSFGVSAKGGTSNEVSDIRVEGCTFRNFGGDQQQVAISTKTPTSGWIIRGNTIIGAGTGMYLGNSNGAAPFVGGLIEGNLVKDPLGYCIQVKWQKPRPTHPALPTAASGPSATIIRHNVLIKNDKKTSTGARPNLLVGGFPQSGAGSSDVYQIYGNFLFNNPHEYLLQASGRVVIHDNLLVGATSTALALRDHDLPISVARVFNNTIYGGAKGISISGSATEVRVVGNLIFATTGISGTATDQRDNLVATVAQAKTYVTSPSLTLSAMDFYPLAGQCEGSALDLSAFSSALDYDLDFNGQSKGARTFRGAYAGAGANPGWSPDATLKPLAPPTPGPDGGVGPSDGGVDSSTPSPDVGVGTDGGASQVDGAAPKDAAKGDTNASRLGSDDGCSVASGSRGGGLWGLLVLLLFLARRRQ